MNSFLITSSQYGTGSTSLAITLERKKNATPIVKEDVKFFLIVDDITSYIENKMLHIHTLFRTKKQI